MIRQKIERAVVLRMMRRSDLFDEEYYRKKARITKETDAAAHYYDGGWRETDPSPDFSREKYQEANPDVKEAGVCPLGHYLLHGYKEQREIAPGAGVNRYHRYAFRRAVSRSFYEILNCRRIRKNKNARILVVAHVFYEDSCGEIIEYLKNLRPYSFDLVVTTTEGRKIERIRKAFLQFKPDAEIRIYPNLGFDVAPYLDVIRRRSGMRYDAVIKIQSKRHFRREGTVAGSLFIRKRDWFAYLFESTVGARLVHKNIDRLINEPDTELIAAANLFQQDPPHKQRMTNNKLNKYGLTLPEGYTFVAGTCFVIKGKTAFEKHNTMITPEMFEKSERNGFSLAHALERYLTGCISPEKKKGVRVCILRRVIGSVRGKKALELRGLRVTTEMDIELDDDFLQKYLECTPVYAYAMREIPVKELYVTLDETRIPLRECASYRYLQGETEQYTEYCLAHRKTDYMELSQEEFEREIKTNGDRRFIQLIERMDRDGYNEKSPVVIHRDGEILDGQGRASWYMHRKGEDSLIRVLWLQTEPDENE